MKYQLIDLLEDSSFISWAHQADRNAVGKWDEYLQQNPHQQSLLEEAALIVRGIQFTPKRLHPQVVEQQWHQLQMQLQTPALNRHSKSSKQFLFDYQRVTLTFISILVGVMGYWYFKTK